METPRPKPVGVCHCPTDLCWPLKARAKALSVMVVDMQEALRKGQMTIKPVRTMMNHNTTQIFFDDMEVPVKNRLLGEGGSHTHGLGCRSRA